MSRTPIDRLLATASAPLAAAPTPDEEASAMLRAQGERGTELWELLSRCNGFYGACAGLLVRALADTESPQGLSAWNDPRGWIRRYDMDLDGALFFAEDVFGSQFALREGAVWTFDPETGEFERLASDLEAWAWLLTSEEGPVFTGETVGAAWQMEHGPLERGRRLRPAVPFVLGGEYDIATLQALPETEIRFLADIANQIRDLPDGTEVVLRRRDVPERE